VLPKEPKKKADFCRGATEVGVLPKEPKNFVEGKNIAQDLM
jgi:hypothetical protein